MTARELTAQHDSNPSSPRRRRSISSRSPPHTIRKRSPSPRITFTPTPLSPDTKGVKNITRKVIRRLEGLGHLELLEMLEDEPSPEDAEEQVQVMEAILEGVAAVNGSAHSPLSDSESTAALINGSAHSSRNERSPGVSEPKKIDWEIPRKLLHSSIGFLTVYFYVSGGDTRTITTVLWTALGVIIPADFLRLRYPWFENIYERVLGFLMRESEKKSINGVVWYILGVNFALSFYPQDVATVAILILSWADTAASTFGRMFGSRTPPLPPRMPVFKLPLAPRKSVAGFLAATITGACIAVVFWGWIAPMRPDATENVTWWREGGVRTASSLLGSLGVQGVGLGGAGGWAGLSAVGIVSGLVSGVAEALDLKGLDDNLTLPIIAGGCILGFFKLLGLFSS